MILVIDSGGTKLDWRSIDKKGGIQQGRTSGFHPLFNSKLELCAIAEGISAELEEKPSRIYYYGAGSNIDEQIQLIKNTLKLTFEKAVIEVNSDLLAAARALCHKRGGIACILGTGSNSCFYDGQIIIKNTPPLGFILGDEGSGTALGKRLLTKYSRGTLPEELSLAFQKKYRLGVNDVVRKVYQEEKPNQFIAGLSKFLFHHLKTPFVHNLIKEVFKEFVENILLEYENIREFPIHFSGSIAFYFNGILREVLNDFQLTVGNIVESPIAGLTLYHQEEQEE